MLPPLPFYILSLFSSSNIPHRDVMLRTSERAQISIIIIAHAHCNVTLCTEMILLNNDIRTECCMDGGELVQNFMCKILKK